MIQTFVLVVLGFGFLMGVVLPTVLVAGAGIEGAVGLWRKENESNADWAARFAQETVSTTMTLVGVIGGVITGIIAWISRDSQGKFEEPAGLFWGLCAGCTVIAILAVPASKMTSHITKRLLTSKGSSN